MDQLREIAARIDKVTSQSPPCGPAAESNTTKAEDQDQRGLDAKDRVGDGNQPNPNNNAADSPQLSSDMERYRRMEEFLLKHRKEWESKNNPVSYGWLATNDERRRPDDRHLGPWSYYWDHKLQPEYPRPNPFELVESLNGPTTPVDADRKDEFDISINYTAARNRVRRSFEWDMDRLFLIEETAIRKQKEAEAKIAAKAREANATQHSGAEGGTGPELKLNYLRWYSFRRLHDSRANASCVIDVLTEDPIIDDDTGSLHRARVSQKHRPSRINDSMTRGEALLPERIRVHSSVLGGILAGMLGTSSSDFGKGGDVNSFVLVRPFKSLFHCLEDLRSLVEKLEDRFSKKASSGCPVEGDAAHNTGAPDEQQAPAVEPKDNTQKAVSEDLPGREPGTDQGPPKTPVAQSRVPDEDLSDEEGEGREETDKEKHPDDPNHTETALQHLKVLMDFMNSEIEVKRAHLMAGECKKVFFADLWYLFRPGQEVIGRDGKQAYRVVNVSSPRHQRTQPWDAWLMFNSQRMEEKKKKKKKSPFSITCVYIDFDGSYIGPVSKTIDFKQFDGQKEITSLPVYPIRLHAARQSEVSATEWGQLEKLAPENRYRQHLVNRGAKFLDVLGMKPMYYVGPTLGVREEIESQVVIDFETAFSIDDGKDNMRQPELEVLVEKRWSEEEEEEGGMMDVECTADCCRRDWVYDDTFVDDKERTRYINSLLPSSDGSNRQPSIAVIPQPLKELKDSSNKTGYSVSDDELVIMSCRVFGFVLRQRRWGECTQEPVMSHGLLTSLLSTT